MANLSVQSTKKHLQLHHLPYKQFSINLHNWGITLSLQRLFCLYPETLLHVLAACNLYLDRFTMRHHFVLNFIANNLSSAQIQRVSADLLSFSNPSIITGDDYCPDILIFTKGNTSYVLELTVGYKTNLGNNINHKYSKYKELIKELKRKFSCVLLTMNLLLFGHLKRLYVNKNHVTYYIKKIITIALRSAYYIFC